MLNTVLHIFQHPLLNHLMIFLAIHATHHHVVHILSVATPTVPRPVLVSTPTSDHHQTVVPSALSIPSVPATRLVFVKNVQILALDHVVPVQHALYSIIHQSVHALKDISEIRSPAVVPHHHHVIFSYSFTIESLNIKSISYILSSRSHTSRSVQSNAMWHKRTMQRWCMYLPTRIPRRCLLWLSSRMCSQFKLSSRQGMHSQ